MQLQAYRFLALVLSQVFFLELLQDLDPVKPQLKTDPHSFPQTVF